MSYQTINRCAYDPELQGRLNAAIAQEQRAAGDPVDPLALVGPMSWAVAAASDVEAAYASALAAGNPHPGGDESVVTDGMILANVQANMPPSAS